MRCHCGGEMVTMTRVAELAREQLELATRIGEHAESDGPTRMRVPSGLWIALPLAVVEARAVDGRVRRVRRVSRARSHGRDAARMTDASQMQTRTCGPAAGRRAVVPRLRRQARCRAMGVAGSPAFAPAPAARSIAAAVLGGLMLCACSFDSSAADAAARELVLPDGAADVAELERDAGDVDQVDAGEQLERDAGELERQPGSTCARCASSADCNGVCTDLGEGSRCYLYGADCSLVPGLQAFGPLCVPQSDCAHWR